jgi:radical SAM superfamily enzyme YgiQ (UPF0313 family)
MSADADLPADAFLVSQQAGATTLSRNRREVVTFDLEGRPQSWMSEGRTYKRSLASEVFGRRTVDGVRRRWRVDAASAVDHFRFTAEVAAAARAGLAAGTLRRAERARLRPLEEGAARALSARLERILDWTPERLLDERSRFLAAYRPVSILPPDQYGSVVVQATYGCSWNRCTFCTFYQDRPFQVREPADFAEHVEAVRSLLGRAVDARHGVFFGDGNALVLANRRLEPLLRIVRSAFPGRPVSSFVDVFGGERKSAGAWRELAAQGLSRVAVGLETGSDALLRYLNKPGGADEAAAFIATLKQAGLAVSVIVMVGAGGARFAEAHERDTEALLARLPLGAGDHVYLSPFVVQPGSSYATRSEADGLRPLSAGERSEQYGRLRAAARRHLPEARVALYSIDEFVY